MSVTTLVRPVALQHRPTFFSILGAETRAEALKLWRARTFTLSGIGFPVMFYVLFGISNRSGHIDSAPAAKYLLAGYTCFGVIGAALFSIGVGLSGERTAGWLELKRASPMPPAALLLAKVATAIVFGLIVTLCLTVVAVGFGGVRLSPAEMMWMAATASLGTIPFAALGLLIAWLAPPNAAAPVVNLLYLPMSFASGLWIPLSMLPHWLRKLAPAFPTYHFSQLMLTVFGYQNHDSVMSHLAALTGFTMIMLGLSALVMYRADQTA